VWKGGEGRGVVSLVVDMVSKIGGVCFCGRWVGFFEYGILFLGRKLRVEREWW
jgi:hypothetical protein